MVVGILSMQRVNNFGSVLQAYALKKIVCSLGNDVSFIDIKKNDYDNILLGGKQLEFQNEYHCSSQISVFSKVDRYIYSRLKHKIQNRKQVAALEWFRINDLEIASKKRYEYCIIGSDEVFNCMASEKNGFTSQLFGNVEDAKKIITYAASCGATTYDVLPDKVKEQIKKAFKNISAFSVRDVNSYNFVKRLGGGNLSINLDPTLVYDFSKELEDTPLPKVPKRYCIVYSYYNRIHETEEIRKIKKFCKCHKMELIAVGRPQYWIKKYISCTPFECLKLFNNAEFVITDTFHGTIFSVKYAPRYAVMTRPSNNNKICDLVKRLSIEKHMIYSINELDNCYQLIDDRQRTSEIISFETDKAVAYLKRALLS